jgi:hypothetical protein
VRRDSICNGRILGAQNLPAELFGFQRTAFRVATRNVSIIHGEVAQIRAISRKRQARNLRSRVETGKDFF